MVGRWWFTFRASYIRRTPLLKTFAFRSQAIPIPPCRHGGPPRGRRSYSFSLPCVQTSSSHFRSQARISYSTPPNEGSSKISKHRETSARASECRKNVQAALRLPLSCLGLTLSRSYDHAMVLSGRPAWRTTTSRGTLRTALPFLQARLTKTARKVKESNFSSKTSRIMNVISRFFNRPSSYTPPQLACLSLRVSHGARCQLVRCTPTIALSTAAASKLTECSVVWRCL